MDDLVAAGLNDGDPQLFATNTLVIAVAPGNPLGIEDIGDLAGVDYAVCAPEVPCGAATTSLFELDGVELDAVSQEQNVTAVAERVASGEVDAGLVYATDVASRADELEAVVPAGADQVVNRYPITTLTSATDPEAAAPSSTTCSPTTARRCSPSTASAPRSADDGDRTRPGTGAPPSAGTSSGRGADPGPRGAGDARGAAARPAAAGRLG